MVHCISFKTACSSGEVRVRGSEEGGVRILKISSTSSQFSNPMITSQICRGCWKGVIDREASHILHNTEEEERI